MRYGGSIEQALAAVAYQLMQYEDREPEVKRAMDELRARVPEGAVVLSGEQKKIWDALLELKLDEKGLRGIVTENQQLKTDKASGDREKLDRDGAAALGLNYAVYHDLTAGLEVEMRAGVVKENGKDVTKNIPHVRKKDDPKAPFEPFMVWAQREKAVYIPALTTNPEKPGTTTPTTGAGGQQQTQQTQQTQSSGAPQWPVQSSTAAAGPEGPAKSFDSSLRGKYPTPSELRQQQKTPALQGA
jgi:hypothetical protein